jgi:hypothetical protein
VQWSWVRMFVILGVNGGVVHGRGFESLTFWGPLWCSAMVVGSNLCLFRGPWWCSAWSWVRIFDFLVANGGVVHGRGLWP